jgi:hypothetical protein
MLLENVRFTYFGQDDQRFDEAVTREPGLSFMFRYWSRLRDAAGKVEKSAISPTDIRTEYLPSIIIYEHVGDGRFKCRLAGTRIVEVSGFEPTGKLLAECLKPGHVPERESMLRSCLQRNMPIVYTGRLAIDEKEFVDFQKILLPLCRDGVPTFAIGYADYPNRMIRRTAPS